MIEPLGFSGGSCNSVRRFDCELARLCRVTGVVRTARSTKFAHAKTLVFHASPHVWVIWLLGAAASATLVVGSLQLIQWRSKRATYRLTRSAMAACFVADVALVLAILLLWLSVAVSTWLTERGAPSAASSTRTAGSTLAILLLILLASLAAVVGNRGARVASRLGGLIVVAGGAVFARSAPPVVSSQDHASGVPAVLRGPWPADLWSLDPKRTQLEGAAQLANRRHRFRHVHYRFAGGGLAVLRRQGQRGTRHRASPTRSHRNRPLDAGGGHQRFRLRAGGPRARGDARGSEPDRRQCARPALAGCVDGGRPRR